MFFSQGELLNSALGVGSPKIRVSLSLPSTILRNSHIVRLPVGLVCPNFGGFVQEIGFKPSAEPGPRREIAGEDIGFGRPV